MTLLDRYDGRQAFRLYLDSEAATAFAVAPAANGRVFLDLNTVGVSAITVKAGWFVVQGSANARQQYYVNPEHVVAVVWSTDEDLP